jgi:hypothetical protein
VFTFRDQGFKALAVLALVAGGGCAGLAPFQQRGGEGESYASLAGRAAFADGESLAALKADKGGRYRDNPSARAALEFALVLTAPAATVADLRDGIDLLEELVTPGSGLDPTEREIAGIRLEATRSQLALVRRNDSFAARNEDLQRALDEANAKIEELLQIERSMESNRGRNPPEGS